MLPCGVEVYPRAMWALLVVAIVLLTAAVACTTRRTPDRPASPTPSIISG
eukprot:m.111833 g.111833  ORF g.111833 m.111833 type:complete len:50 (+) comp17016_c0_seq1:62-211(+)